MILGSGERRTELQSVGGTYAMDAQDPDGDLPDASCRLDLAPGTIEAVEALLDSGGAYQLDPAILLRTVVLMLVAYWRAPSRWASWSLAPRA